MFQFMIVIGLLLAYYGYTVMKNPRAWGDQGRHAVKPENWNAYVVQNGRFLMYSGFLFAAIGALDVVFTFATWLFILLLLGGVAVLFLPLSRWMQKNEGGWYPWPKDKAKADAAKRRK